MYEMGRITTTYVVDIRHASYYRPPCMAHDQRRPDPTEAELEILRVLWTIGPSTVKEVFLALQSSKLVGYTTVLKQLQVMHRKGLVRRSERFRAHVYEPGESRAFVQRQLARSLLKRAFDGSAHALLQSALAGRRVSPGELAEIRRLLEDLEGGAK